MDLKHGEIYVVTFQENKVGIVFQYLDGYPNTRVHYYHRNENTAYFSDICTASCNRYEYRLATFEEKLKLVRLAGLSKNNIYELW